MGVDSGLPTYRGPNGSYGQLAGERQGSIFEIMTPAYLRKYPKYMWERFFRRILAFADTEPHAGYHILKKWSECHFRDNYFLLSSNIDSFFQKTGFPESRIYELHGSIHHIQCATPCQPDWVAPYQAHFRAKKPPLDKHELPRCPHCGDLLRPNAYLFRDRSFVRSRIEKQRQRYLRFLDTLSTKAVLVLEIGAGTHVQAVRMNTRKILRRCPRAFVIRINPDYPDIRAPHWGVAQGAKVSLQALDSYRDE